ncbi:MAG: hydrogenase expression/formation protein [Armatimonadetes bacterium]|nr:hydrogenase expression/formation protein [Armatimonadota bacterium]NIM23643.1 hydrogenase expression/formation protein [Armatimonadota bacterium]NIM67510.1 hydrogenase expression/formation protein [Armatimonadota bacterium]NIM76006.1 hydrogenase expression/formation protein [Armatimonadota bacterium]NIN05695.1 hydrogenase expression/formation protein [Armatimonadota bacterium]
MRKARTDRDRLKIGKIPHSLLEKVLAKNHVTDPRVILGPRLGEDAAAVALGDRLVIASTDPITFASDLIGWYVVHVNANDIAVMGAEPKWFLCTALFSESATTGQVESLFEQITEACRSLDISLIGGHAEITAGLDKTITIGTMLGEIPKGGLITSEGVRPGDDIILAGEIAVEGTALLAREFDEDLRAAGTSNADLKRARGFLLEPGISVVKAALAACSAAKPHAMHDPTEGGLATGLMELAKAAGVGLLIEEEAIPILESCRDFCDRLHLKPLGLIASGCLLIAASPEDSRRIIDALQKDGIIGSIIGKAMPAGSGLKLIRRGKTRNLPRFARDEIARLAGK